MYAKCVIVSLMYIYMYVLESNAACDRDEVKRKLLNAMLTVIDNR